MRPNQQIKALTRDGKLIENARISKVLAFRGLERTAVDVAEAGDIVAVAGITEATVADTLCDASVDIALPALPIALDGYRFTVVSDLHLHTLTEYHRNILAAVERTAPDCILIAGDSIDEGTVYVERLTPFFTALARIAPVAACVGNNDCDCLQAIRDVYEEAGVTLLEDETRTLPARGVPLLITGLQDPLA